MTDMFGILGNVLARGILDGDVECANEFFAKCGSNCGAKTKGYADGGVEVVTPEIRTVRADGETTIYFDMPGASKDTIDATVKDQKRLLSVTAMRADGKRKYVGNVTIGEIYDLDAIKTSYADGVLAVSIPKKEAKADSRKLSIG